jgi:hypothetical protein
VRPFILAAVLCLATARLDAQVVDLQPGVRLRFRPASGEGPVKGTLLSRTPDSLVVATEHGVQYRLATHSITELAVSGGKTGSAGAARGLKWGAGIAGSFFFVFALGFEDSVRPNNYTGGIDTLKAPNPLLFAGLGAAVYGGIGSLIGAAIGAEEWRTVGLASPSLSVAPDRVRLGFRLQR